MISRQERGWGNGGSHPNSEVPKEDLWTCFFLPPPGPRGALGTERLPRKVSQVDEWRNKGLNDPQDGARVGRTSGVREGGVRRGMNRQVIGFRLLCSHKIAEVQHVKKRELFRLWGRQEHA